MQRLRQTINRIISPYQAQIWDNGKFEIHNVKEDDKFILMNKLKRSPLILNINAYQNGKYDFSDMMGIMMRNPKQYYTIYGNVDINEQSDLKESSQTKNDTYYRFEVLDHNSRKISGGLFRGLNEFLEKLYSEDNPVYDDLNYWVAHLEYVTPFPENFNNSKAKFAYKESFVNKFKDHFDNISELLDELDWELLDTKIQVKNSDIVYEDDAQIAYTNGISLEESQNNNKDIDEIETPEQLMNWMEKHITYELANDEYGAEDDPPTKTAEEVIETGTGHCAEQSYLEYKVLNELGYFPQLIFVKENDSEDDYGADGSAHMFVVYQDGDEKYTYFEHSQEHNKGIHKFDSMSELFDFVGKNWWRYDDNSDILEVRYIDDPIIGVNNWKLAQECHKYPVDEILDYGRRCSN